MRRLSVLVLSVAATASFTALATAKPGGIDRDFSKNGRAVTGFGKTDARITDLARARDGRIIAAGFSVDHDDASSQVSCDFALVRYRRDGREDPEFSDNGKAKTNFGTGAVTGEPECAQATAVDTDRQHRVVAGGSISTSQKSTLALARYEPDGDLDQSFSGGRVLLDRRADEDDHGIGCCGGIEAKGGKIVVGITFGLRMGVARFNADGSLDESFSDDGIAMAAPFGDLSSARDVAIQRDGRIVLAGLSAFGAECEFFDPEDCDMAFAVARFEPDGSVDTSFGTGGGANVTGVAFGRDAQDEAQPSSVALQRDGRILVGGTAWVHGCGHHGCDGSNPDKDFALVRYTRDGLLDDSFSGNGVKLVDVERKNGQSDGSGSETVLVGRRGRIYLTGSAGVPKLKRSLGFVVLRFKSNGKLDPSFAGNGKRIARPQAFAYAAVRSGTRIVVGGEIDRPGQPEGRDEAFSIAAYERR